MTTRRGCLFDRQPVPCWLVPGLINLGAVDIYPSPPNWQQYPQLFWAITE
jgi:hypothetical protein